MTTSFKRIIKSGWKSFSRNIGLSIASVFITLMVIFLVTFLYVFNVTSNMLTSAIQQKIDVSVYFKQDVGIEDILSIKGDLSKLQEVKDIEYISKEKALEVFKEKHKDDTALLESLTELGDNPFLASLSVKVWESLQYNQVVSFLDGVKYKDKIEKVDYFQRKPVIDKIFSITSGINRGGLIFGSLLLLISILVAINTIRIAIANLSEEIATMRLVGASNWFIRSPFLFQGIVVGVFSTIISLFLTFLICYGLDSKVKTIAPDISVFGLFLKNFWNLLLLQLLFGVGLGIVSSTIAIRKYLKI